MTLLRGRTILVTGVLTKSSIAWHVASAAQREGARVILTGFGRTSRMTKRAAIQLAADAPVVELDVSDPDNLASLADRLASHTDAIDGVLHAIAHAPATLLGGSFLDGSADDAKTAFQISAWSLAGLTHAVSPLLAPDGASIVGLDFDASVAWPTYNWMGVAKAALESTSRYLARDLGARGVRVNLVSAGPLATPAAGGIPGFAQLASAWREEAPLGWDVADPRPVADVACFLLSDLARAVTGEIIHADGGTHAVRMSSVPP